MKRALSILLLLLSCQRVQTQEPIKMGDSYHELSDWEVLQMAIIMTESRGNPDAVGKTQDYGVLQITPVYVAEVNRLSDKEYSHEDAFSIQKSLEMFGIVQGHHNPDMDIEKAIRLHNRATWYRDRVMQNMDFIRRMETARKAIYEKRVIE